MNLVIVLNLFFNLLTFVYAIKTYLLLNNTYDFIKNYDEGDELYGKEELR